MADGTHIEWTDATWNIITGCSVISAGCKHCYAMKLAGTRLAHHSSREGLTIDTAAGPVWNGEVRFNEQWLLQPLDWTRPRRIFVCAHGDLFHESVPDEWICAVFAIMASAPHHTFQVLTKRPQRARQWFERMRDRATAEGYLHECLKGRMGYDHTRRPAVNLTRWPLPNVWMGVSVEDQAAADARIPELLSVPAHVRFLSIEPLLGAVRLPSVNFHCDLCAGTGKLARWPRGRCHLCNGRGHIPAISTDPQFGTPRTPMRSIDWVIVGGESGPGARPMHPDWIRALRDQCAAARVPFLFKQWGQWQVASVENGHYDSDMGRNKAYWVFPDGIRQKPSFIREGWTGGDPYAMTPVGKKRAGRKLDGVEHNGFPEVRA